MKERFIDKNFRAATLAIIITANKIIEEYRDQGFILTLRQLYYQFVARDLIPNTERSYKRLGSIVNDGRLAGLIDWLAIEDRTRNINENTHWNSPAEIIEAARRGYAIDMWANQDTRVEVWIEKNALIGIIEGVCRELDVPYFACIGYVSQSEQWRAYKRHAENQRTIVIHLGDHDPSGIDMTRDNQERLDTFHGWTGGTEVKRIALNMDQVDEYGPPPNPAKVTDSRFEAYLADYGEESWELDALEPSVMVGLIRNTIDEYRDPDLWEDKITELAEDKATLDAIIEGLE